SVLHPFKSSIMSSSYFNKDSEDILHLVESAPSTQPKKGRKFGWTAAITVILLFFISFGLATFIYNGMKTATTTVVITVQPGAMIHSMSQTNGWIMKGVDTKFILMKLQGTFGFTYHNATVESYKLSIFNDDGVRVGSDARNISTLEDSAIGIADIYNQVMNETTGQYFTHFFVRSIVTIEEGQAGYANCKATPFTGDFKQTPTLSLRFVFSIVFRTDEVNFLGHETIGHAEYTMVHTPACGCYLDVTACLLHHF
ncbi:hypothetical protein PFISCL1PPCAC_25723, partial [Pristionchus fissidentatus]